MTIWWTGRTTGPLDVELQLLNQEVDDAIAKRKAWMDSHMEDYASMKVGESIYNTHTGECLGVISELYRYHANDPRYDRSMSINYRYKTRGGWYSSTSSQPYTFYGTKEEASNYFRCQAEIFGMTTEDRELIAALLRDVDREIYEQYISGGD